MSQKTLLWFLSKIWRRNKHQEPNISGQLKQKHRRQVQIKTQPAENFVVWYRSRSSQKLFSQTPASHLLLLVYISAPRVCPRSLCIACCESCFADSSSIFTFQVPLSRLRLFSSIFTNISRFPDDHHSIMSCGSWSLNVDGTGWKLGVNWILKGRAPRDKTTSPLALTSILNFQWQKQMIMINLIILSRWHFVWSKLAKTD